MLIPPQEPETTAFKIRPSNARSVLIGECKQQMFQKVREDRHKTNIEKNKEKLPQLLKDPQNLVGKTSNTNASWK